jgi:hypothetical protein
MTSADLFVDLERLKDDKKAAFDEPLFHCDLKSLGVPVPTLRALAKTYHDIDPKALPLDSSFEVDFLFFQIGLGQTSTPEEANRFLVANQAHLKTWAITDSLYQLYPLTTFLVDRKNLSVLKKQGSYLKRFCYLLFFRYLRADPKPLKTYLSFLSDDESWEVSYALGWLLTEMAIKNYDGFLKDFDPRKYSLATRKITVSKIRDTFRLTSAQKEKAKALILGL